MGLCTTCGSPSSGLTHPSLISYYNYNPNMHRLYYVIVSMFFSSTLIHILSYLGARHLQGQNLEQSPCPNPSREVQLGDPKDVRVSQNSRYLFGDSL